MEETEEIDNGGEMVKVFPKRALQQNFGETESTTTIIEGPDPETEDDEDSSYTCIKICATKKLILYNEFNIYIFLSSRRITSVFKFCLLYTSPSPRDRG